MGLPDEIRRRMAALGHSTASLAAAAGVRDSFVKDIIRSKSRNPRAEQVQRLASALGCTVEDLTGTSTPQPSEHPRASRIAAINAKLQTISTNDLDMVLRLLDAVQPAAEENNGKQAA